MDNKKFVVDIDEKLSGLSLRGRELVLYSLIGYFADEEEFRTKILQYIEEIKSMHGGYDK